MRVEKVSCHVDHIHLYGVSSFQMFSCNNIDDSFHTKRKRVMHKVFLNI